MSTPFSSNYPPKERDGRRYVITMKDTLVCGYCNKECSTSTLYVHMNTQCKESPHISRVKRETAKELAKKRCCEHARKPALIARKRDTYINRIYKKNKKNLTCDFFSELPPEHFLYINNKLEPTRTELPPKIFNLKIRKLSYNLIYALQKDLLEKKTELHKAKTPMTSKTIKHYLQHLHPDKWTFVRNNKKK